MTEQDRRQERAARNQTLFREVNARLVELNESFEQLTDRSVFVCECAALDCIQEIDMTLRDYARVRENPRRFVVAPGDKHVLPDVERVVERHDAYLVVEKIGRGALVAESPAQGTNVS